MRTLANCVIISRKFIQRHRRKTFNGSSKHIQCVCSIIPYNTDNYWWSSLYTNTQSISYLLCNIWNTFNVSSKHVQYVRSIIPYNMDNYWWSSLYTNTQSSSYLLCNIWSLYEYELRFCFAPVLDVHLHSHSWSSMNFTYEITREDH